MITRSVIVGLVAFGSEEAHDSLRFAPAIIGHPNRLASSAYKATPTT